MDNDYLLIGEITKPQGVRGEIKVRPITCDPYRFEGMEYVYIVNNGVYEKKKIGVRSVSPDAVYMRMEGIITRDDAEKIRGTLVYIDREHAVELGEDENFLVDLIGCDVFDEEGACYGRVTDVMQPGGNDVYVCSGKLGEILIPALKIVIMNVDVAEKKMLVDKQHLLETAVFPDSETVN